MLARMAEAQVGWPSSIPQLQVMAHLLTMAGWRAALAAIMGGPHILKAMRRRPMVCLSTMPGQLGVLMVVQRFFSPMPVRAAQRLLTTAVPSAGRAVALFRSPATRPLIPQR